MPLIETCNTIRQVERAFRQGDDIKPSDIHNALRFKAEVYTSNEMMQAVNANTVDAKLKRSAIIQSAISSFARRLLPVQSFSTVIDPVPRLEGNNKVSVPYYGQDVSDSQSFDSATGYSTVGNTDTSAREIEIGEGAAQGDRIFQALQLSSSEIARQPFLKAVELLKLKLDKLASDIIADILSIVTEANYGPAALVKSGELFNSDDLVSLKLLCKLWPENMRSLILDSDYDASLIKDPTFKSAYQAAFDSVKTEGQLFPRVMGFDYIENPNVPNNGENLKGMAVHKSAILVAFAPIIPISEVQNSGTEYETFLEPKTGITLSYRSFGDSVMDRAVHLVETSYGYAKANPDGIKRICAP
jgi:hypothetical protein